MPSNLPPGVTDGIIPGNRPEDQEIEFTIYFTMDEIENLKLFLEERKHLSESEKLKSPIYFELENLMEQIEEQLGGK